MHLNKYIRKIQTPLDEVYEFIVSHVYREENNVANRLSNIGVADSLEDNFVFFEVLREIKAIDLDFEV